ncbi:MAG TPA: helix-turn-helix domain-containing protein, partial [Gaiellaceae bacterium]|nr:helix-turn-helix domain-containing protein [Gaiellaceae bacterium]
MLETRICEEERGLLERWVGAQRTPQSVALRARIVLAAAAGESNSEIARTLGVSRPTVILWRSRYADGGAQALTETRPGRGRKPSISAAKIKAIV